MSLRVLLPWRYSIKHRAHVRCILLDPTISYVCVVEERSKVHIDSYLKEYWYLL